jgi:hypothetical protein
MEKPMHRSLIAVALLLLAQIATAQVYKWTDAHGTIHYSETPPPAAQGANYKKVKANGSVEPLVAPAPAASSPVAAAPPAPPVADTPENRNKMCDSLRANLSALQGNGPVVMQEGGKAVALDGTQRRQQTDAAQSQYQQYCQSK